MANQKRFDCVCCGKRCQGIYISSMPATGTDVTRWKKEKRYDILEYVAVLNQVSQRGYYLWIKNGKELLRCPFLRKGKGKQTYHCAIYATRPNICKDYPSIGDCLRAREELQEKTDTPKERTTRRIIATKATASPADKQQIDDTNQKTEHIEYVVRCATCYKEHGCYTIKKDIPNCFTCSTCGVGQSTTTPEPVGRTHRRNYPLEYFENQ